MKKIEMTKDHPAGLKVGQQVDVTTQIANDLVNMGIAKIIGEVEDPDPAADMKQEKSGPAKTKEEKNSPKETKAQPFTEKDSLKTNGSTPHITTGK